MKPRHSLIAFSLACILWVISVPATAVVILGETLTPAEAAAFPPVCKLIIIEKPEANIGPNNQLKYAALFDRPEYRMAKNASYLHHWCRALVARHRYFNARSEQKRRGYRTSFYAEMDWVIRHMSPSWPYGPQMHAEKGEMHLLEKNYGEAVNQAYSAIRLNQAFPRAYALLVNVYNAMGQKGKALESAAEGVRQNPQSGSLKKMYDELGGPKPYPEPYAKPASPAPKSDSASADQLPPPASDDFMAADVEEAVTQPLRPPGESDNGTAPPDAAPPGSAPRPNKYCRFCP